MLIILAVWISRGLLNAEHKRNAVVTGASSHTPTVPFGTPAPWGDGLLVKPQIPVRLADGNCWINNDVSGCAFQITISNNGSAPADFDVQKLRLVDASGRTYSPNLYRTDVSLGSPMTLQPGQATTALYVNFLVPPHTTIKYLALPASQIPAPGAWQTLK